jgi:hypothetical protein
MNDNREEIFCADTATSILLEAVSAKAKMYNKNITVTPDILLKREVDLTVFDFGDILVELFNKTQWIDEPDLLIKWFAKNDRSIRELVKHIEYVKKQLP